MAFFQDQVRRYNVHKNRRQFDDDSNDKDDTDVKSRVTPYVRRLKLHLPILLTDSYRQRHHLSASDYKIILRASRLDHVWQMAILHCREITANMSPGMDSGVAPTSTGGLTVLINKLMDHFASPNVHPSLCKVARLVAKNDQHNPRLPVHFVDRMLWDKLVRDFPCLPLMHYSHLFEWNKIYLLPFAYYNGYLQMVRVLPRHVHAQLYGKPGSWIKRDEEFLVNGVVYCQTPESILLQTQYGHEYLTRMSDQMVHKNYYHAPFVSLPPSAV